MLPRWSNAHNPLSKTITVVCPGHLGSPLTVCKCLWVVSFLFAFWVCVHSYVSSLHSTGTPRVQCCSLLSMTWQLHFPTVHQGLVPQTTLQTSRLDPAPMNGLTSNQVTLTFITGVKGRGKGRPVTVTVAQRIREEMKVAKDAGNVKGRRNSSEVYLHCSRLSL